MHCACDTLFCLLRLAACQVEVASRAAARASLATSHVRDAISDSGPVASWYPAVTF
jgi:hypothetical protein